MLGVISSCEDCEDCAPVVTQPSLRAVFINQDSLMELNDSIDSIDISLNTTDSLLSETNSTINQFIDSLFNVEAGIDTGNTALEGIRDILADTIEVLELQSNEYQNQIDSYESKKKELNSIIRVINSGNVWIREITNLLTEASVTYEDSSTLWSLPVDLNQDSVKYQIRIDRQDYQVSIRYSRDQDVNVRRQVILSIENIEISNYVGFDTVTVDEKTLTLYF